MRTLYLLNGEVVSLHKPVTIDGITYPHLKNVWQDVGVVQVEREDYPDPTYYTFTENPDGTLNKTPKTAEQILQAQIPVFERALDVHMDSVARAYKYNDRFTFALRAGYPGPWQAEGLAFAQWMDTCNLLAYQMLEQVQLGQAAMPATPAEFIATLPEFTVG